MVYSTIINLVLLLLIKCVVCHLKDMGEVAMNWTNVLEDLEARIVGGSPASINDYPFNVQFFNFGGLCGGSVLTEKTVLTAAHCFDYNKNLDDMKILSNPRFVYDLKAMRHEVWDFIIHEQYNKDAVFSNDIAIIIIHDTFELNTTVQKAPLVNTDVWMRNDSVFVATGWGETQHGEGIKNLDLKQVKLYFVSKETCMAENRITIGPEMFCLHGDGERDTCRGDSGGGVLWNGAVVGITSHGRGCATTPSMYVNVYYFKTWIVESVALLYDRFCNFHGNKH